MKMLNFIKSIWQLPQNIVGAIVKKVCKAEYVFNIGIAKVHYWNINGGLSLGKYIFVRRDMGWRTIKHEYGHTIQSKYLGWLYLPVIAIPSLIWAGCFNEYRRKNNVSYYDFYTEKWANKLGGVADAQR